MDRRTFLAAAGGGLIATPALIACQTQDQPAMTFSRNGITLPFYEHEMPGHSWGCTERETIRKIFYDLDENSEKEKDNVCWEWVETGYRFPIDKLNSLLKPPFRWYGWFESDHFHLLTAGFAKGRYEYSNHAVCMFEREMYSGDGHGCSRDKCLLPGPYQCHADVTYGQAKFEVRCNSYWTTTLPDIGCVVRWRYKAHQNGEPYGVRIV